MQSTRRLLATLTTASGGSPARFLTPGNPTGLTGLLTHPSPRSTLIYLYSNTLSKLSAFPSSCAYRVSLEALTKHRLSIVEAVKPERHEQWLERANALLNENPNRFQGITQGAPKELSPEWVEARIWERKDPALWGTEEADESAFIESPDMPQMKIKGDWEKFKSEVEIAKVAEAQVKAESERADSQKKISWETAPSLEAKQISEIEEKIGAGLIEEVIEVARGELKLVGTMAESKVWEELSEKPAAGQWEYFAREQHMPGHEEPGKPAK